jgi:spermidine/putrescine transport system permease protein
VTAGNGDTIPGMPGRPGLMPGALYLALLYTFIFLPVIVLVLFSFQGSTLPVPPFTGPSLRWYREVLADDRLMAALGNSLAVGSVSALAATVLGFLAAHGLARRALPGGRVLEGLILAPLTVSYVIIGMGLLVAFNALGVSRSLLAAGVGHVVINLPLCFAILFAQMGEAQARLERAARDLAAAEWQVLLLVTVPLLWPALFAAFFLSFTLSWDEFIVAFLLTRFDVTLPVEIWSALRTGLDPTTNAVGSLVFGVSIVLVLLVELVLLRRPAGRPA